MKFNNNEDNIKFFFQTKLYIIQTCHFEFNFPSFLILFLLKSCIFNCTYFFSYMKDNVSYIQKRNTRLYFFFFSNIVLGGKNVMVINLAMVYIMLNLYARIR